LSEIVQATKDHTSEAYHSAQEGLNSISEETKDLKGSCDEIGSKDFGEEIMSQSKFEPNDMSVTNYFQNEGERARMLMGNFSISLPNTRGGGMRAYVPTKKVNLPPSGHNFD
jgi:hypothetical protein